MTGKPIRSEPLAEEELLAAAQWYEGRCAGLGDELIDAVSATLERVRESPEAYTPSSQTSQRNSWLEGHR